MLCGDIERNHVTGIDSESEDGIISVSSLGAESRKDDAEDLRVMGGAPRGVG